MDRTAVVLLRDLTHGKAVEHDDRRTVPLLKVLVNFLRLADLGAALGNENPRCRELREGVVLYRVHLLQLCLGEVDAVHGEEDLNGQANLVEGLALMERPQGLYIASRKVELGGCDRKRSVGREGLVFGPLPQRLKRPCAPPRQRCGTTR